VTGLPLAVGDLVVYKSHGAGSIVARSTRDVGGQRQEVVVLSLAGGLSIELPLARAEELLRPVAGEAEIKRLQKVLTAGTEPADVPWLKRRQDALAKLTTTVGLAEIISDSASRTKAGMSLSPSEREVSKRALDLLANEIALARGVELEEANRWIADQVE
jgi:RNA polymerase-interacting CarD/CdnL/TRCF family regulator